MDYEYEALRHELLAWQNRRFTVLIASTSIVTGILGLEGVLKGTPVLHWGPVTSLLLFFLGAGAAMTWYAGRANAKIAAYIILFYEAEKPGWETRLAALKDNKLDWFSLNRMIVAIYAGLGILSFLVPWAARSYAGISYGFVFILGVSAVWFLFCVFYLLLRQPSKDHYKSLWRNT